MLPFFTCITMFSPSQKFMNIHEQLNEIATPFLFTCTASHQFTPRAICISILISIFSNIFRVIISVMRHTIFPVFRLLFSFMSHNISFPFKIILSLLLWSIQNTRQIFLCHYESLVLWFMFLPQFFLFLFFRGCKDATSIGKCFSFLSCCHWNMF